jgi:PTS system nitrogen regulatory IIA component
LKLSDLLKEEMVILTLNEDSKESVLKEMVGQIKRRHRFIKEKDLYDRLVQRENLGSTAIGAGVAIPHCKLNSVKEPLVLLAVSRKGVDFHSIDGNAAHIFFLVVSSQENPSLNLQILAAIAHLVRRAERLQERILAAESPVAILAIIREEENKLHE